MGARMKRFRDARDAQDALGHISLRRPNKGFPAWGYIASASQCVFCVPKTSTHLPRDILLTPRRQQPARGVFPKVLREGAD